MTISDQKYEPIAVPIGGDVDGENPLVENLIAKSVAVTPSQGQAYLEVVAPATLPEGYTFEAEANGQRLTVTVPVGGVMEGQTFCVPYPGDGYLGTASSGLKVPEGAWKDGLCDCFQHGICHPALCNAIFCQMVLAGQVMQRLKLTWLGNEGTAAQTKSTFKILLMITIVYLIASTVLRSFYGDYQYYSGTGTGATTTIPTSLYPLYITDSILDVIYGVFLIVIVFKTRRHIRHKYHIPEKHCKGCEDCCCAYWCTCCTVAQMARHTADYDLYSAQCCSERGLPSRAPQIVDL